MDQLFFLSINTDCAIYKGQPVDMGALHQPRFVANRTQHKLLQSGGSKKVPYIHTFCLQIAGMLLYYYWPAAGSNQNLRDSIYRDNAINICRAHVGQIQGLSNNYSEVGCSL